jgi:hypothetical protein
MKMATVLRIAGAIIAAIGTALVLLMAVELFSSVVHPVPPDFQGTMEEMCLHVERYPHWVLAAAVPMWGFTALASTWVAGRLGNRGCALFAGLLLLGALTGNILMLPYTVWFKVVMPIVLLAGVVCGFAVLPRRKVAAVGE